MAKKVSNAKRLKRELARLNGLCHERSLHQALSKLNGHFNKWKRQEIDSFELSDAIHQYHKNDAREVWLQYVNNKFYDLNVSYGLIRGLIQRTEISDELFEFLEPKIERYRKWEEEE